MDSEETPPSAEQIEIVVEGVKNKIEDEGKEFFHGKDVAKLVSDDKYVTRFWIHTFFMPGNRVENTVNMVINTFKWRKEFGLHDISEKMLDDKIKNKGALYTQNRDRDGFKILVFCLRKHVKDPKSMQSMKEFFVYMLDRLEREEGGRKITIIFDSENASFANFDIEIVRFVIQVLICFYPAFVSKILVYQMPWVLNAAWKIVKSLLPAPAVAMIMFVSKSTIEQLVSPEWGTLDTWDCGWVEEGVEKSETEVQGDGDEVKISPEKMVIFSRKGQNNLEAEILIKNVSSMYLAYKVKSTSPSLFLVRPHTAMMPPGQDSLVRIQTAANHDSLHSRIPDQQFQINYLTMEDKKELDKDKLSSLFSNSKSLSSTILSCGLEISGSPSSPPDNPDMVNNIQKSTSVLSDKVIFLEEKLNYLQQILLCQGVLVLMYLVYKWLLSGYSVLQEEADS